MAQTAQTEPTVTGGGGGTRPPAQQPTGGFGNPTTLILLLVALAIFLWNMRRRRAIEERMLTQRREQLRAEAEMSARNVAHVMRATPPPGAAAAAAAEGLASAAPGPTPSEPLPDVMMDAAPEVAVAPDDAATAREQARERAIEDAEVAGEGERTLGEQAERAMRESELAGESAARRIGAAEAAAAEAQADTADAQAAESVESGATTPATGRERGAGRGRERARAVPAGAVAGDGTTVCPPAFPIKGNAQSKIYHEPGQVSYPQTIAEFCFASAEAAAAAGYRQSRARVQRAPD